MSPGPIALTGTAITRRGIPTCDTRVLADGATRRALFGRRKDYAASGLTYTVQFTADLAAWEDSTATPTVTASDAEMEAVTVPFPALLSNEKAPSFFRVRIDAL